MSSSPAPAIPQGKYTKSSFPRWLLALQLTVAALLFAANVRSVWGFTLDDAYIFFRYASNIVHGIGPKFNAIDGPAEGCTSPLYLLICTVPELLHIDIVLFAKLLGLSATVGYTIIAYRICDKLGRDLPGHLRMVSSGLVVLTLAAFFPTAAHAISGMETAFYTLTLTSFLYATLQSVESPGARQFMLVSILALLCGATRPEGNLAAAVALLTLGALIPRQDRPRLLLAVCSYYILPGTIFFFARYAYYGLPFPLPFYAKIAAGGLLNGLPTVESCVVYFVSRLGLPLLVAIAFARRSALPAGLAVVAIFIFFIFPRHLQAFDRRFLFPLFPFLFSLASFGAGQIFASIESLDCSGPVKSTSKKLTIVAAGWIAIVVIGFRMGGQSSLPYLHDVENDLRDVTIPLGKHLAMYAPDAPADQPVLAIEDAGAVPFFSKWNVIDYFSLNDVRIVRSSRFDPEYVMSRKPILIVLRGKTPVRWTAMTPNNQALYDCCTKAGMVNIKVMRESDDYYLWLFAYPRSRIADDLSKWKSPGDVGVSN